MNQHPYPDARLRCGRTAAAGRPLAESILATTLLASSMLALLLAAGSARAGEPVVHCVDPADSACFRTIQAGVDAADPGDIVEIQPHPDGAYEETVVVDTAGLTIRGATEVAFTAEAFEDLLAIDWAAERRACSLVRIDVCNQPEYPGRCAFGENDQSDDANTGFLVTAPDVTLSDLTIRQAFKAVRASGDADRLALRRNCFVRARMALDAGARTFPPELRENLVLSRNRFFSIEGFSKAIQLSGNGASIEHNLLLLANGLEIRDGDLGASTVRLNALVGVEDSEAISIDDGSGHLVEENYLSGLARTGIVVGSGFPVDDASGSTIRGNRVEQVVRDAIEVRARDSLIAGNTVIGAAEDGVFASAPGLTVSGNLVISAGGEDSDPCLFLGGEGSTAEDNVLRLCARGIDLNSDPGGPLPITFSNTLRGNVLEAVAEGGIVLRFQRGSVIDDNVIIDARLVGLRNDDTAFDTVVTDNTIGGSRQDVCNDGTIATFTGNSFDTGGPAVVCKEINR